MLPARYISDSPGLYRTWDGATVSGAYELLAGSDTQELLEENNQAATN